MRQLIVPAYLAIALVLGGSSSAGYSANLLLQVLGLPIVAWAMWSARAVVPSKEAELPVIFSALLFALVLIQLVPLPPAIWSALPGRAEIASEMAMVGVSPGWMPLSLNPAATVRAALWLLPAFAVLLGILLLGAYRDRWIAIAIVAVTVLSVLLGAIQIAGGTDSMAYLYERTNRGIAVGFFANGNHQATLLLVSLPFIAAIYRHFTKHGGRKVNVAVSVLCVTALIVVLIGIATNGSLAGFGLAIPVAFASLLVVGWRRMPRMRSLIIAQVSLAAISAAVVLFGPFGNNLFGADAHNSADSRYTVFTRTSTAVIDNAPFGTGLASFVPIYKRLEAGSTIDRFFMNNAHNDYLQIALEAGLPGIILVLLVLAWITWRSVAIWRSAKPDPLEQAATIAIAAIAVHSLVDYPLRTASISCVFAACVALVARPRRLESPRRSNREQRGVHLEA